MSEKYNERVREIAEKMAERKMGKAWNNTGPVYRRHQIDGFLPYARIAVTHMASEVKRFLQIITDFTSERIAELLKEQGLIPDSAQDPGIEPSQPGDSGSIHNPDNPEPEETIPYCTQCGSEDMAYVTQYANGEEWKCKECGHMGIVPYSEGGKQ